MIEITTERACLFLFCVSACHLKTLLWLRASVYPNFCLYSQYKRKETGVKIEKQQQRLTGIETTRDQTLQREGLLPSLSQEGCKASRTRRG